MEKTENAEYLKVIMTIMKKAYCENDCNSDDKTFFSNNKV